MAPEKAVPDLVLDLNALQLIRAGRPVKLEKTPMELLTLLVRRQGSAGHPRRDRSLRLGRHRSHRR